ncbi:MAG: hypothetical protein D6695_03385 [Planctomycetota bacterium]|nr:MAG: hypothetical protein D6695_03385 [Planctomycetota bacterium]
MKAIILLRSVFAIVLVSWIGPRARGDEFAAHRAELLEGVSAIGSPGVPGPILVAGPRVFPVVVGKLGDGAAPVVVAGEIGRGRFVGFGHNGYFSDTSFDTRALVINAVRWAGVRSARPRVLAPKPLAQALIEAGMDASAMPGNWAQRLEEFDVVCLNVGSLSGDDRRALESHMRRGGGVLFGGLGWGWMQINKNKTLAQHPGNVLFAEHGAMWADGYMSDTIENGFDARKVIMPETHALFALDTLEQQGASQEAIAQASETLMLAVRTLPLDDRFVRPRLRRLEAQHAEALVVSDKSPLRKGVDDLERLLLAYQIADALAVPPERVRAHASADNFPGRGEPGATRVARTLTLDPATVGWKSTGLYAEPGQVIVVSVPESLAGKGLSVRIGCHTDRLYAKQRWNRAPEIALQRAIVERTTRVASAFGGLVYIVLPDGVADEPFEVTVRGAIEAPWFVLGTTDPDRWRQTIRHFPAPWAELQTDKVVLSVPSSHVRDLDDPVALMEFWDRVLDAAADLAAIPRQRKRPQRYVADRQISAGYMHSGYPIMTHLDAAEPMTDLELLRRGNWGLFHELGHNHQHSDWTFAGTGEVTCNLFSLYIIDTLCVPGEGSRGHQGVRGDVGLDQYLADGAPFDQWKRKPFLALRMYIQLADAFGWDAYKRIFAEYRSLSDRDRPKSDEEKRDQWMVRFSRTVGRNLGPFFQAWGVPTSQEARDAIADLPVWMPEGFPDG